MAYYGLTQIYQIDIGLSFILSQKYVRNHDSIIYKFLFSILSKMIFLFNCVPDMSNCKKQPLQKSNLYWMFYPCQKWFFSISNDIRSSTEKILSGSFIPSITYLVRILVLVWFRIGQGLSLPLPQYQRMKSEDYGQINHRDHCEPMISPW